MLILGIESSCDDAAAAVLETTRPASLKVRSSAVANQDDIHRAYGGIVPELASRNHVVTIMPVIERALASAGCTLADIDGIAVTRGPGLVGSLLVGLMCAKGLAQASGIPMVGVNHIEGHLLAPLLENRIAMPYLALVVSGGHTALFAVEDFGRYRRLGRTRDDAAGEAFDKVAKLMGLGYPGGKSDRRYVAPRKSQSSVQIPRAHVKGAPLDFSFSGVKTAVATILSTRARARRPPRGSRGELPGSRGRYADAPDHRGGARAGADTIALTGGVAANSRLRDALAEAAAAEGRGGRTSAQVLHRQRRDDRDGGQLSPAARRARRLSTSTPKPISRCDLANANRAQSVERETPSRPRIGTRATPACGQPSRGGRIF